MVLSKNIKKGTPVLQDGITFATLTRGVVISYAITLFMFILFSAVLTTTDFPEKYIDISVFVTMIISITLSSIINSRKMRNNGWLNGTLIALIYVMILFLISSSVVQNFAIQKGTLQILIISIITGSIGGIIGINFRKGSHNKKVKSKSGF